MSDRQIIPQGRSTIKPEYQALRRMLWNYREEAAYLVWLAVPSEDGKVDKVPCDPKTGQMTAPNSARDRGVLTLSAAIDAAKALEDKGLECGVGVYPPNAGLIAIDLDKCVVVNGIRAVAPWAQAIAAGSYAEISPSGTGIRILVNQISEALAKRANGHERNGVGVYGAITNRFVTLTGVPLVEGIAPDIGPLPIAAEKAIWNRFEVEGAKGLKAMVGTGGADGYPHGQRGMDMALEDILTGASLHPAMVSYLSRAAMLVGLEQAREDCLAVYYESDAKTKDPERWQARAGNIDAIVDWIRKQGSFKKDPMPTQLMEAAKQAAKRMSRERYDTQKVRPDDAAYADRAQHIGPWGFRYKLYGGDWLRIIPKDQFDQMLVEFDMTPEDCEATLPDDMDALWLDYLQGHGMPIPPALEERVAEDTIHARDEAYEAKLAEEQRLHEAQYLEEQSAEQNLQTWLVDDCPSLLLKELMIYMLSRQMRPSYGLTCSAALVAAGVIIQNGVVAVGEHETGANIAALVIADSGSGKSVVGGIIKRVVRLAVHTEMIGKPESAQGLYDAMLEEGKAGRGGATGNVVVMMDEADDYLKAISSDMGSDHRQRSMNVITEAWPEACRQIEVAAASRRGKSDARPSSVIGPYLNLMMLTTPEHAPGMVARRVIRGGFFGRVLYLRTPSLPAREVTGEIGMPPEVEAALARATFALRWPGVVAAKGMFEAHRRAMEMAARAREPMPAAPAPQREVWVRLLENGRVAKPMMMTPAQRTRLFHFLVEASEKYGPVGGRASEVATHVALAVAVMMKVDEAELLGVPLSDLMPEDWAMPEEALDYAMRVVSLSLARLSSDEEELEAPVVVTEGAQLKKVMKELRGVVHGKRGPVFERYRESVEQGYIPDRYFGQRVRGYRERMGVISSLVAMGWLEDVEIFATRGRPIKRYRIGAHFGENLDRT